MSLLDRLKNFLTGEDTDEKKKASETTKTNEPETKQETPSAVEDDKPIVGESAGDAEVKAEKPAAEEKPGKSAEISKKEPEVVEKPKKEEPKTKGSVNMSLLNKEENLVVADNIDPNFKQSIMDAGAESVALCYQCGTCTGSCPSGKRTPYRIRNYIRRSLMGLKEDVMEDETIWECVTCYACQERCPRGVKIVDVVKIIRNMQSQAGKMAKAHKMVGTFVLKTGHGVPINDATMELRKRVGLNKLPPTTHEHPEALKEVQDILKKTQFDSLIKYNWETGELE